MTDDDIVHRLHAVIVDGAEMTPALIAEAANEIETLRGTHLCWAQMVALMGRQETDMASVGTKYSAVLKVLADLAPETPVMRLIESADQIMGLFSRSRKPLPKGRRTAADDVGRDLIPK